MIVMNTFAAFANYAPALHRDGWAVLPVTGKKPAISSFPAWKRMPGQKIINEWATKYPDAGIGYVAGRCSGKPGKQGIIAVDADDEEAMGQAEDLFGTTPGKIETRRGAHFLYDGTGANFGNVSDLRACGLNLDLKHGLNGSAIGILPPSVHANETSFHYKWLGGADGKVLAYLPPIQISGLLQRLLDKCATTKAAPTEREIKAREGAARSGFRAGSRKLGLNDHLVSQVPFCFDLEELLDVARTWNDALSDNPKGPLDDNVAVRIAKAVWAEHEQSPFRAMFARDAAARTTRTEQETLLEVDHKGAGDAHLFLSRSEWSTRRAASVARRSPSTWPRWWRRTRCSTGGANAIRKQKSSCYRPVC